MNKWLLHVEGFSVFLLSSYLYWHFDLNWVLFISLLLVPDLSMLGYLRNAKFGAFLYNMFHTYSLPIFFLLISSFLSIPLAMAASLIWLAHIGVDRMFGFGLKYASQFNDTHLNRV